MSTKSQRRHRRYKANLVAEVTAQGWDEVLQLATDNISRGGLFIRTDRPMKLGATLQVTLNLPDDAELTIEGIVAHVMEATDGAAAGFGVRFDEKHATDLNLLAAMAASNLGSGTTEYELDRDYVTVQTVLLDREKASIETTTGHQLVHAAIPVPEPEPEDGGYDVAIPVEPIVDRPVDRGRGAHHEEVAEVVQPEVVSPQEAPIFGIDFGTSFSSISLPGAKGLRVLEDGEGNTMFPSVVCYHEDGHTAVGWDGLHAFPFHPSTTFVSPKRLIGRRFDDERIEPFMGASPVRFMAGAGGDVEAEIYGERITMVQVGAEVFRHLMKVGETACGVPVRRIVLSVPVHYRDERPAIKAAAELAGLEVVDTIDEPVAAAMAYGLGRDDMLAAVYDFGGGTFDFTLMEVKKGRFKIVRRAGDAWLGGDDFDNALANHAADAFRRRHGVNLRERKVEWQRLLFHCEATKRKLSFQDSVDLRAGAMVVSLKGAIGVEMTFDRALLGDLCGPLVDQSIAVVEVCLEFAKVTPADVETVVAVGGTCRMPLVRERLGEHFQKEIELPVDPEHIVVVGDAVAARFAALKRKSAFPIDADRS